MFLFQHVAVLVIFQSIHRQSFNMHLLFQLRYVDPRLVFHELSPNRKQPIVGGFDLLKTLWSPHIFMANARASNILGTEEKDVLTSVSPDGTVIISSRIQATLNCWMDLQMYPFDAQKCPTIFESCKFSGLNGLWHHALILMNLLISLFSLEGCITHPKWNCIGRNNLQLQSIQNYT